MIEEGAVGTSLDNWIEKDGEVCNGNFSPIKCIHRLPFHVLSEMLMLICCFHKIPSAPAFQVLLLLENQE